MLAKKIFFCVYGSRGQFDRKKIFIAQSLRYLNNLTSMKLSSLSRKFLAHLRETKTTSTITLSPYHLSYTLWLLLSCNSALRRGGRQRAGHLMCLRLLVDPPPAPYPTSTVRNAARRPWCRISGSVSAILQQPATPLHATPRHATTWRLQRALLPKSWNCGCMCRNLLHVC